MTRHRIVTSIAAIALLTGACSSASDSDAGSPSPAQTTATATSAPTPLVEPQIALPPGASDNSAGAAGAGLSRDGQLWIVTYGSSTNPLAVHEISADGQQVTVVLGQNDGPATMDLVPATSTIALPDGVDPTQAISVVLDGLGTIELDPPTPGKVAWLPGS